MEREPTDDLQRVRIEVADILASALLDMILSGNEPDTETGKEGQPILVDDDEERPSCP